MSHDLPPLDDDNNSGETRPAPPAFSTQKFTPEQGTRRMDSIPPPPNQGQTPQRPPQRGQPRPPRRGRARQRRDSGLYLPLWSIALMLLVVIAITAGIVLFVVSLGQNNRQSVNAQGSPIVPTQPPPVVVVSSPVPTVRPDAFPASPATPTIPPQFDPVLNAGMFQAPPDFSLAGPTLPTVEISPTPMTITVGVQVLVVEVGDQQLNVRDEAGIFGTNVIFRANEGERFNILAGPQQIDNLSWWQIADPRDPNRTGWAASQYLQAVPPQ